MRALEATIATTLLLIAIGLFATTFSADYDVPTFGGDVGPAFAPRGYLLVWMLLAALTLFEALRKEQKPIEDLGNIRRLVAVSSIGIATGLAMLWIGFVFAAIPGFFLFCRTLGYRNYIVLAAVSIIAPLAIWWTFTFAFELLLPRSPWFGRL